MIRIVEVQCFPVALQEKLNQFGFGRYVVSISSPDRSNHIVTLYKAFPSFDGSLNLKWNTEVDQMVEEINRYRCGQ